MLRLIRHGSGCWFYRLDLACLHFLQKHYVKCPCGCMIYHSVYVIVDFWVPLRSSWDSLPITATWLCCPQKWGQRIPEKSSFPTWQKHRVCRQLDYHYRAWCTWWHSDLFFLLFCIPYLLTFIRSLFTPSCIDRYGSGMNTMYQKKTRAWPLFTFWTDFKPQEQVDKVLCLAHVGQCHVIQAQLPNRTFS